jgi:hypothetical protein
MGAVVESLTAGEVESLTAGEVKGRTGAGAAAAGIDKRQFTLCF